MGYIATGHLFTSYRWIHILCHCISLLDGPAGLSVLTRGDERLAEMVSEETANRVQWQTQQAN